MTWHTGPIDRSGENAYVHLVRAPDDPDRTGSDAGERRGWETQPHRRLNRMSLEEHRTLLLEGLADGHGRTFNRLAVELYDKTADVLFTTTANDALWALVEAGRLEHTLRPPILFRRADVAAPPSRRTDDEPRGVAGLPVNPAVPRWSEPGPDDDCCDLCHEHEVAFHDARLCPYAGCHWSLQVCEPCGGFDTSRELLYEHLKECKLSIDDTDHEWDDNEAQFVACRQLALF